MEKPNTIVESKKTVEKSPNMKILISGEDYLSRGIDNDERLLIPYTLNGKVGFINKYKEIVAEPKYAMYYGECYDVGDYIKVEGFNHAFGLLNSEGREILPLEYDKILDISQTSYEGIITIKGDKEEKIPFGALKYLESEHISIEEARDKWAEELYEEMKFQREQEAWEHYQEYGAYEGHYAQDVMGYSDGEIDDAFDGDPDAYWNID